MYKCFSFKFNNPSTVNKGRLQKTERTYMGHHWTTEHVRVVCTFTTGLDVKGRVSRNFTPKKFSPLNLIEMRNLLIMISISRRYFCIESIKTRFFCDYFCISNAEILTYVLFIGYGLSL